MIQKIKKNIDKAKERIFKYLNSKNSLVQLYVNLLKVDVSTNANNIGVVIFSMDRALQLHALIGSFLEKRKGNCEIIILYRATTEKHQRAYEMVEEIYGTEIKLVRHQDKTDFKSTLIRIITNLKVNKMFFLVDDIIFTEELDLNILKEVDARNVIFSLRMGDHLSYSYVVNKAQALPQLNQEGLFISWDWTQGELDWAYPLSVDGHVFNRNEILLLCKSLNYHSPTSFEESLQVMKDIFATRVGRSYKKAIILNNPCNKVQNEVNNFHGGIHQDMLLEYFLQGKIINYQQYYGYVNSSVHEEVIFTFKDRYE